jgi:hypothetical protein
MTSVIGPGLGYKFLPCTGLAIGGDRLAYFDKLPTLDGAEDFENLRCVTQ